ncbi:hypothetical protein M422DRAFT_249275 [Sphaerobolus stellatus SS14]|uniref:Uncharacterized protein n=1 Tax=Sphaerobolus stellatus (strain SS14) TaxID=990650 RepID=A0A0C9VV98_SPHS4|nr:hypothetical protein M422DRAFT_249275 [Sphaerobolus stellatus SS14]
MVRSRPPKKKCRFDTQRRKQKERYERHKSTLVEKQRLYRRKKVQMFHLSNPPQSAQKPVVAWREDITMAVDLNSKIDLWYLTTKTDKNFGNNFEVCLTALMKPSSESDNNDTIITYPKEYDDSISSFSENTKEKHQNEHMVELYGITQAARIIHWVEEQVKCTIDNRALTSFSCLPFRKCALLAVLHYYMTPDGTPIRDVLVYGLRYVRDAKREGVDSEASSREEMLIALIELRKDNWVVWVENGVINTITSHRPVWFTTGKGRTQSEIFSCLSEGLGVQGDILAGVMRVLVFRK